MRCATVRRPGCRSSRPLPGMTVRRPGCRSVRCVTVRRPGCRSVRCMTVRRPGCRSVRCVTVRRPGCRSSRPLPGVQRQVLTSLHQQSTPFPVMGRADAVWAASVTGAESYNTTTVCRFHARTVSPAHSMTLEYQLCHAHRPMTASARMY